jgi:hypothetical protein
MIDFFNLYKNDFIILYEVIVEYLIETNAYGAESIKYDITNYLKNGCLYPQYKRNGEILNYRLSETKSGTYVLQQYNSKIELYYIDELSVQSFSIIRLDVSKMEALVRDKKLKMLNLD